MKHFKKFLGIAAIFAVIGFLALPLTGCSEDDSGGGGGGGDGDWIPQPTFDYIASSINDLKTWLASQPANPPPAKAYNIALQFESAISDDDFKTIKTTLNNESTKYVYLDFCYSGIIDHIPENLFSGCNTLTGIYLPFNIYSIGANAFSQCTNLTSVTIGGSLLTIGEEAFVGCSKLNTINGDFSNNVFFAENNVLYKREYDTVNSELVEKIILVLYPAGKTATSFLIPAKVTDIGNNAFRDCINLKTVSSNSSSNFNNIGNYAFKGCTNLLALSDINSLSTETFSGCSSLIGVTIGNGVTSLGTNAFSGCTSCKFIGINNTNATLRSNLSQSSNYGTIFPSNDLEATYVVNPGNLDFCQSSKLKKVTIKTGVTYIGSLSAYTFMGCTNLTSITFEEAGVNFATVYVIDGYDSLTAAYTAGGAGTYTRDAGGTVWTKQ